MLKKAFGVYRESFGGLSKEVWLLSSVMLINRAGSMVIPFLAVYLTQELGFSLGKTGWVMSAFGAGSVLGAYVGGRLIDRIGFYFTQFWSLFISGFAFIALGYVESFYGICLVVFITSTIADAFRPANFAAIAAYSHIRNRTRAIALLRMAINLGWALGPAAGGMIALGLGYGWLFWIDGLTCIAAALFFRWALPIRHLPEEESEEEANLPVHSSVFRDRKYVFFLFLALLNAIAFMQLFSTLPVFMRQEILLDEGQIGRLMAVNGLCIGLLEMPLIYVLENRFKPLQIISIGTLLIGLSFLLFNMFGPLPAVALACMLTLTFGEMLSLPFISTLAIGFTNQRNRGAYMGLFTVVYSLSHIIAPNLGLQMASHSGFPSLWWFIMGASVFTSFGFWAVHRQSLRPAKVQQQL